jgi:hypothetical protein
MGNALQVDDVVKVTNKQSSYYDQKGIIKCMHNNTLFLWDRKFIDRLGGIFVEKCGNVTLKGYELVSGVNGLVKK